MTSTPTLPLPFHVPETTTQATKRAGTQFVQFSLEEMAKFLTRSYHALKPEKGADRGEIFYDLSLSDKVAIRVWTSIGVGYSTARPMGGDAIKVQLRQKGPSGKILYQGAIVKRTQGWKDSLQDRISETMEEYDSNEAFYDNK